MITELKIIYLVMTNWGGTITFPREYNEFLWDKLHEPPYLLSDEYKPSNPVADMVEDTGIRLINPEVWRPWGTK